MNPDQTQILSVIFSSIDELNDLLSKDQRVEKSLQSHVLARLDSLGFVNFVSLLEEKCRQHFGKTVVLTQTDAATKAKDPFETVQSLADYLEALLKA